MEKSDQKITYADITKKSLGSEFQSPKGSPKTSSSPLQQHFSTSTEQYSPNSSQGKSYSPNSSQERSPSVSKKSSGELKNEAGDTNESSGPFEILKQKATETWEATKDAASETLNSVKQRAEDFIGLKKEEGGNTNEEGGNNNLENKGKSLFEKASETLSDTLEATKEKAKEVLGFTNHPEVSKKGKEMLEENNTQYEEESHLLQPHEDVSGVTQYEDKPTTPYVIEPGNLSNLNKYSEGATRNVQPQKVSVIPREEPSTSSE